MGFTPDTDHANDRTPYGHRAVAVLDQRPAFQALTMLSKSGLGHEQQRAQQMACCPLCP